MQKYLTKSQTKMSSSEARIRKFVFVGKAAWPHVNYQKCQAPKKHRHGNIAIWGRC